MYIAISILFLLCVTLSAWLVSAAKIRIWWKLGAISLLYGAVIVFWISVQSMMGWSANPKWMPEIVTMHSVVVQEPNPKLNIEGAIFMWLEITPQKYDSLLFRLWGYHQEHSEPRAFKLPYSRQLHEQLEAEVMSRLRQGQIVRGKLILMGVPGDGNDGDGDGSHSREQEWVFYDLKPSYFQQKR